MTAPLVRLGYILICRRIRTIPRRIAHTERFDWKLDLSFLGPLNRPLYIRRAAWCPTWPARQRPLFSSPILDRTKTRSKIRPDERLDYFLGDISSTARAIQEENHVLIAIPGRRRPPARTHSETQTPNLWTFYIDGLIYFIIYKYFKIDLSLINDF